MVACQFQFYQWRFACVKFPVAVSQFVFLVAICQWWFAVVRFFQCHFASGGLSLSVFVVSICQWRFVSFSFARGDFLKAICQCQFGFRTVLGERLEELKVSRWIETIQSTALLRLVTILRRVLKTWETCCNSDSSGRPSADTGVTNSNNNNNNNDNNKPADWWTMPPQQEWKWKQAKRVIST